MASDQQLNSNATGGGNGNEGNNNQHNDVHGHGAPNNNGSTILTYNTLCGRCSGDYFVNVNNPVNPHVNYLRTFPAGYRFAPSDEELIQHYLIRKIKGIGLPPNNINWVTIYAYHPARLIDEYRIYGEKEWYFFLPRDRKYPNGIRPDRAVGPPEADTIVGYWKATVKDTAIEIPKGTPVGYKKTLAFYEKKATRQKKKTNWKKETDSGKKTNCKEKTDGEKKTNSGKKTDWMMHEYRTVTEEEEDRKKGKVFRVSNKKNGEVDEEQIDWQLQDYVLCRIYQKPSNDDTLFETPIQRAEHDNLVVDNTNSDDGEVAGTSSPTAPDVINATNTPSSLTNGTCENIGSFSSTLVDLPFPLPTLPGHLNSSNRQQQQNMPQPSNFSNLNHQQQHMPQPSNFSNLNQQRGHMPQPPNTFYNSNQQQQHMQQPFDFSNSHHLQQHMPQPPNTFNNSNRRQQHMPLQYPHVQGYQKSWIRPVQQPINVHGSNMQHQMEMLPQQVVQQLQQQELQNIPEFSRRNINWCSRNLETCESSYSSNSISDFSPHHLSTSTQAHYPPDHLSTFCTPALAHYNPHHAAALSSFPPPNHHPHDPSIVNEHHILSGFGFPYDDPSTSTLVNFATPTLTVPPLVLAYPDQCPVIESHQANLLTDALPLGVNDDY